MPDTHAAVVPATQTTVTATPTPGNQPSAQATMNVSPDGFGSMGLSGIAKILGNLTMVAVVAVFAYLMLDNLLQQGRENTNLLRDGMKTLSDANERQVEGLKEVRQVGYQNQRVMRESAESLDKVGKSMQEAVGELKRIVRPPEPAKPEKP